MFRHGIAIVAITRRGVETAVKIQAALAVLEMRSKIYAPKRYLREGVIPIEQKLDEFFKATYSTVDALVAVMATGITIRAIAPYLTNKLTDPAVVGVDANGKFAISLLSGHYGGANELTRLIAEGIGATPVITTASDSLGKQSVDELARTLHLTIMNPKSLVAVNAAIVDGDRLALILVGDARIPTDTVHGYTVEKAENVKEAVEIANAYQAAAIVTDDFVPMETASKPIVVLKPKRIVIGVGARKEISEAQILNAVYTALAKVNLPLERVNSLATIDIKRDSQSIMSATEKLGLKLEFVSIDELRALRHEDLSPDSKLVLEKMGVGGVCEQAALIKAGKTPHLLLKKQKLKGVTVAIAEGE